MKVSLALALGDSLTSPVTLAGLKSTCYAVTEAARSIFEWLLEVKPENGLGQHFYFRGRLKKRIIRTFVQAMR